MTYAERMTEAARLYTEARDAALAKQEADIKARYAELRAEDKAAGRDTSGKSVQRRQTLAFDQVIMSDEHRAIWREVDKLEDAYRALAGKPAIARRPA